MSDFKTVFDKEKNPIEIYGFVCTLIIILGCVLKELNLPFSNMILIFGFGGICLVIMPYYIISKLKEGNIVIAIGIFFFNTLSLGLWFKVMKWPFVEFLVNWSLTFSLFGVIPIYLISNYLKKVNEGFTKEDRKKNILMGVFYSVLISSFYLIMR